MQETLKMATKSNEIFVPFFCRYSYLVVTLNSKRTALLKKVTSYCNAVTWNVLLQCPENPSYHLYAAVSIGCEKIV